MPTTNAQKLDQLPPFEVIGPYSLWPRQKKTRRVLHSRVFAVTTVSAITIAAQYLLPALT